MGTEAFDPAFDPYHLILITLILNYSTHRLQVGSLFIPLAGQLKCPFNLKAPALRPWESSFYYFFHNFLPSACAVLATRNSSVGHAEPLAPVLCVSYPSLSFSVFLHFLLYFPTPVFVRFTFQDFFILIFRLSCSILFQQSC